MTPWFWGVCSTAEPQLRPKLTAIILGLRSLPEDTRLKNLGQKGSFFANRLVGKWSQWVQIRFYKKIFCNFGHFIIGQEIFVQEKKLREEKNFRSQKTIFWRFFVTRVSLNKFEFHFRRERVEAWPRELGLVGSMAHWFDGSLAGARWLGLAGSGLLARAHWLGLGLVGSHQN